jgi:hypothetical protein
MTRRRRRERSQVPSALTQLGLAWYSREDWERLHEIADDRDKLDDTYEDWERQALEMIQDLEAVGQQIRKVPIDIEALIAWCRERKCRIDMAARSEYVSYLLSQGKKDAPITW